MRRNGLAEEANISFVLFPSFDLPRGGQIVKCCIRFYLRLYAPAVVHAGGCGGDSLICGYIKRPLGLGGVIATLQDM